MSKLGMCDKRQYEHNGPHELIQDHGQRMPPFPCVNWHPVEAGTSPLMEKLKRAMPADQLPRDSIERATLLGLSQQPILHHAEAFVGFLGPARPVNDEEMVAPLWCFGERIAGDLEKRLNYMTKVAQDALAANPFPVQIDLSKQ